MEQGPCNGTFENWFFDKESDTCRPFQYGGCKGNDNRYATESACNYQCKKPGVLKSEYWTFSRVAVFAVCVTKH